MAGRPALARAAAPAAVTSRANTSICSPPGWR